MAKTTVGELVYKISGDTGNLGAQIHRTERRIHGLGAAFGKVNTSKVAMLAAGTAAFAGLTAAIVSSTRRAMEFESTMGDIGTLIGDDANKVERLSDEIRQLSREVPKSANELGGAAYHILSAGITDTAEAMETLEYSSKLAVAGLGSTEDAVDLMTGALNTFRSQNISAEHAANVFFETVRTGKTTVAELGQSFGRVSPLAATLGVKFEELQAATAALTTANIQTSQAHRGLRGAMTALMRPSAAMNDLLEEIGVESGRAAIETYGFVGTLRQLQDAADGNDEVLARAMGRVEGLNAVLSLAGEQGETFNNILEDMTEGSANLERAFNTQAETTENRMIVLQNRLNDLMLEFGTKVLPAVNSALESTLDLLDDWDAPNEESRDFIRNTESLTEQQKILRDELERVKRGTSDYSVEQISAANQALQLKQEQEGLKKALELTNQVQEGGVVASMRARKALEEYGHEVYTVGLLSGDMRREGAELKALQADLRTEMNENNMALRNKEEALEAILNPYKELHEEQKEAQKLAEQEAEANRIIEEELRKQEEAMREAKQELKSFQDQMVSFIEESQNVRQALEEDLTESFKSFGEDIQDVFEDTRQGMADMVVDAEESAKDLRQRIRDEEDAERRRDLREQLREHEEILEAREGFEERQAEKVKQLREELAEAGIDAEEAGLFRLEEIRTLEEEIEEERRLRAMNEFEIFEEQQFKKMERLTQDFITEVKLTREKIEQQKKYEEELTQKLINTSEVRKETVSNWAEHTIKEHDKVADSLERLITLERRVSRLGGTPVRDQYHAGGWVGAGGGDVHVGEYVIPANLTSRLSGVVSAIEEVRQGNTINNNTNQITQNVEVHDDVDFNAFSRKLAWELERQ